MFLDLRLELVLGISYVFLELWQSERHRELEGEQPKVCHQVSYNAPEHCICPSAKDTYGEYNNPKHHGHGSSQFGGNGAFHLYSELGWVAPYPVALHRFKLHTIARIQLSTPVLLHVFPCLLLKSH